MLKTTNLVFHFVLELCALAALAHWGFQIAGGWLLKNLLGVGVPLLAAAAWGTFRVPNDPGKAPVPAPGALRLALELGIMGLACAGMPALAMAFGLAAVINYALMYERLFWLLRL